MPGILSSIACNLDAGILQASLPLFEAEKVQAIEWSFDTLFKQDSIPEWFGDLLQEFGQANRLIGHGVYFSLFSGKWSPEQQEWLERLKKISTEFHFDHITEHFGFMTGQDFHQGAPISIPFTTSTLALGIDRLKRLQDACKCPVGLENLAFSYSIEEVQKHGDFLNQLVEPVNGFIILDLHNLFCQLHNFDIDYGALVESYPLDRVREIHISGGSWETVDVAPGKMIRRDTHDASVPPEVFDLLEKTLPRCPNLKYVVLEQLGTGLQSEESRYLFRQDFYTLDKIVERQNKQLFRYGINTFLPRDFLLVEEDPPEDNLLSAQQSQLTRILETAGDYKEAIRLLQTSALANTSWGIEKWTPAMLETAIAIAQKWKNGYPR